MGTDSDKPTVALDLALIAPPARELRRPRWTLVVEGLGKVRRARIRTAPLTLLVGENNSGKSYLATLLWSLHRYLEELLSTSKPSDSDSERACNQWLRGFLRGPGHATLASPDGALFLAHFNEVLRRHAPELLARAFNREGLNVARVSLDDLDAVPIGMAFDDADSDEAGSRGAAASILHGQNFLSLTRYRRVGDPPLEDDTSLISILRESLTRLVVAPDARSPFYLPASRTGFMLLYPDVIKRDIERRKIGWRTRRDAPAELTAPMIEFLEFLALGSRTGVRGPHHDLADALEAHLHGNLEIASDLGTRRFAFRPKGSVPLPMALSSSLVTELTPIIAALRHEDFGFIVLEEPEAHLHPELQCVMARLLVRLVRRGVQVCVTTHSENFCQQIGNLLKIGRLRELCGDVAGYGPDEYLRPEDVAAYEFQRRDDGTEVVPLETHADGIAMPLFNKALMRLTGETVDLQRAIDEHSPAEPEA